MCCVDDLSPRLCLPLTPSLCPAARTQIVPRLCTEQQHKSFTQESEGNAQITPTSPLTPPPPPFFYLISRSGYIPDSLPTKCFLSFFPHYSSFHPQVGCQHVLEANAPLVLFFIVFYISLSYLYTFSSF